MTDWVGQHRGRNVRVAATLAIALLAQGAARAADPGEAAPNAPAPCQRDPQAVLRPTSPAQIEQIGRGCISGGPPRFRPVAPSPQPVVQPQPRPAAAPPPPQGAPPAPSAPQAAPAAPAPRPGSSLPPMAAPAPRPVAAPAPSPPTSPPRPAPAPALAQTPAVPERPRGGAFEVRLGAFAVHDNALGVVRLVAPVAPAVIRERQVGAQRLYRVLVVDIPSRDVALGIVAKVGALGLKGAMIGRAEPAAAAPAPPGLASARPAQAAGLR